MTQNTYSIDNHLYVVQHGVKLQKDDWYVLYSHGAMLHKTGDRFGHGWSISQHSNRISDKLANLTPEEDTALIIATTNPTISSVDKFDWPGEEVDELALLQLASESIPDPQNYSIRALILLKEGWIEGYKAAPKKQWSDEDMRKAYWEGVIDKNTYGETLNEDEWSTMLDKFLQSLRPIPTYIEFEKGYREDGKKEIKSVKY